jgi:multisubunit Na+/H+ antiporter MnhB subunit
MSESDEKATPGGWLWPFGGAIATLLLFPAPEVVLFGWSQAFKVIGAAGLIIGVAFGYIANRKSRPQSNQRGACSIALVALIFLALTARYFHVKEDAENHFSETIIEFFSVHILIGALLFFVAPAIKLMNDAFRRHD